MANNAEVLMGALEYIEAHIAGEIPIQEIADYCYVSVSGLQKTFKYAFHISVKEYMLRRRFTCAAKEMLSTENSILDIALKYGYSNAESFTRGFRKIWGITPSEYRRTRHFAGHTPRFSVQRMMSVSEDDDMGKVKYDLTELYDVLQERRNNAYICVDLYRLMEINDTYGSEAGDAALLELMRRVEEACADDDVFLRVGGDEFIVFTGTQDSNHAEELVKKVQAQNGNTIKCGEIEIPVSLRIGTFKSFYERHVNVADMFANIEKDLKIIQ